MLASGMRDVSRLIEIAARATGRQPSTMGRLASGVGGRTGDGSLYSRLRAGGTITIRRAERIAQWLSDRWPEDAEWPADIPRPAPATAERAQDDHSEPSPVSDPVAAARAARERMLDALLAHDDAAADAAEAEALRIGGRLNAAGRIASPAALCAALGVDRRCYDNTVGRYAHGRAEHPPRRRSDTARMLTALRAAGDVRFTLVNPGGRMTKEEWTLAVALLTVGVPAIGIAGAWLHERYAGRAARRDQASRLLRAEAEAAATARADRLGWEGEALLWRARQAREDAELADIRRCAKVLTPPPGTGWATLRRERAA